MTCQQGPCVDVKGYGISGMNRDDFFSFAFGSDDGNFKGYLDKYKPVKWLFPGEIKSPLDMWGGKA